MGAFEELTWRGLVQQTTAENMGEVLATPLTIYVGCDPSAAQPARRQPGPPDADDATCGAPGTR